MLRCAMSAGRACLLACPCGEIRRDGLGQFLAGGPADLHLLAGNSDVADMPVGFQNGALVADLRVCQP